MKKGNKNQESVMVRLATFVVDKRNLFFLLVIIGTIFTLFSRNWVEVENDLSSYLPIHSTTRQGLDVMEQLAKQAKDWLLVGWIRFYRRHPSTIVTRWVAHILHHSIHFGFVKTLTETIKKETAIYPRRLFGKSGEERLALCLKKANARKEELEKTGAYVEIVRQEPFTIAKDQLDLKVYLLVSRQGMVNQKIQVEEIEL